MRHITSPTPSVTEGPTPQVPDNNWQENWQKNTTKTYGKVAEEHELHSTPPRDLKLL